MSRGIAQLSMLTEARPVGRVKGGIDIIGTALEALHGKAAIAEGARQGEHQRGLAGTGGGSRDDEAARHHVTSGKRGEAPTGR